MNPVYLDHAATTPVRDEVRAAMAPHLDRAFGNPSSTHRWGREAAAALAEARARCAQLLGARFSEIHFVRGGTESDNLAIAGRATHLRREGLDPTVVVTAVEHKAVLDAAAQVAAASVPASHPASVRRAPVILPVTPEGSLDLDRLDDAVAAGPAVVSVMWVNNETGMILPVPEVAARLAGTDATLHTDAVQAVGKVPVRVDEVPLDLLSVTAHKIYGPKGMGLLFVREGTGVAPLLHGGGQERGLRPGTEDVAGAVGLATALECVVAEREETVARLGGLRDALEARLVAALGGLRVNAGGAPRAPHVSSVAVPAVDGASLVMALDLEGIAVSGGSACNSGAKTGSHVIAALYGDADDRATVRFSLGRATTEDHIDRAVAATVSVVERLRAQAGAA